MSRIEVQSLVKEWSGQRAVDNLSFVVEEGSFTVLLGPSGCGKSTTLRMIAGLEDVTGGRVMIGERDVTNLDAAQRNLAMVFQSYALFPHLSVAENIVFGLKVRKVKRVEREQRLQRVAEIVGLEGYLERKPAQLSGGQRQRVALARAIIAEYPVCLMDEPLSNLDAKLRGEMRAEIRGLQRKLGITMVYVTHDQTEAMSMADQVVLLRDGRCEQIGTPDTLYNRPQTAFAARFLGLPPMNLLRLSRTANGTGIVGLGDQGAISFEADEGWHLGLRPEDIEFCDEGVPARVTAIDYLGADSVVSLEIGGQGLAVRTAGHSNLKLGEAVHIGWNPTAAHLFDAQGVRAAVS
ncbi:ABC transporter ATP-binding protein [Limibacillus halophilus]|uniref:sn-glycerol 3-phosphate transport system ATP-binding protein n=1 Tax=Limibacillus halophilus TaxID=1579333 RepID=A0A839SR24_9PROT|nr:ABC transporter ATP-binding protein [Limibacillus halophilus]MBB3064190.1 sn-glycerol 3-phosphate transport system ATP-binding protein [Limibacillus halophilus]